MAPTLQNNASQANIHPPDVQVHQHQFFISSSHHHDYYNRPAPLQQYVPSYGTYTQPQLMQQYMPVPWPLGLIG